MPNDLHKFKIHEVVNIKPESIFNEFMHEWNNFKFVRKKKVSSSELLPTCHSPHTNK